MAFSDFLSTSASNISSKNRIDSENQRLDALRKLNLLHTPLSESFDRITRMAAQLFQLPISAISLTDADRQWFKSRVGVAHDSIPRVKAPCSQVADTRQVLVISDLKSDKYYRDSPLSDSGIRFYAGAPLMTHDGYCLGAICMLGAEPRTVSEAELAALQDMAKMVMAQIELQHALGRVDPLSGLPNRNQFIDDLSDLMLDRPHAEERFAAQINLANPEEYSNAIRAMGSAYLDEIIGEAVLLLRTTIGQFTNVYHITTMEFAFIAPLGMSRVTFCETLEALLRRRAALASSRFVTTASFGVAAFEVGITSSGDLLRNLHSAAHHAAESNIRVSVFSSEQDAIHRRNFLLINEYGAAMESKEQLHLTFQPKVELVSGTCVGAEALLRWTHPTLGEISPGEFIPLIERTSMVRETTHRVLDLALRQIASWRAADIELEIAVNVSAINLQEPDFCEKVVNGLRRHGLPASCLALEITESALMENPRLAQETLQTLSNVGVRLAIDDFGTGYSSMAYLQSMPAQVVKIDQSFIRNLECDKRKRSLVLAMIKLLHELGHWVVAEGVETIDAATFLKDVGCDEVQGYLYAPPLKPDDFTEWLSKYKN